MRKRLTRFAFVLALFGLSNAFTPGGAVVQGYDDDNCVCHFEPGSVVSLQLWNPMYQWVADWSASAPVIYQISPFDSGGKFTCQFLCSGLGKSNGNALCRNNGLTSGVGFYSMSYYWDFYDFNNDNGGSGHGYEAATVLYDCP